MTKAPAASALQIDVARQVLQLAHREKWPVGYQIVEKPLSESFGVSRSPVRRALELLAQDGLLELIPNHGFVVLKDLSDRSYLASFARSESDQLRQNLLRDRSKGLIPQDVSENELTDRYGVSRGTIRKALTQLSSEGLVHRQRGHGWAFVDSLDSPQSLAESYRFRIAVETAALREPSFDADRAQLDSLLQAHENFLLTGDLKVDSEAWISMNIQFHESLALWSGNRFFHQAIKMQNNLRLLHESSAVHRLQRDRVETSLREHIEILQQVRNKDLEMALVLLRRHLEKTLTLVEANADTPVN